jgi:serine/threonine protein kinase
MSSASWQRVEQLYHEALAQAPEQRSAWLAACTDEEPVRAEVARLLAAHAQAGGFLSQPAVAGAAAECLETAAPAPLIDRQISHYRLLSRLGAGGMGEVYLARDVQLGRQAALKLLPEVFTTNADRLHRFEQEARAASALNHPNILTIYEIGVAQNTHFIATEFIDGETLRQRLKGGALPLAQTLDIAVQLAAALAAAHAAGIIHRDLKPENAMVRRDGLVKVLDFGLAKLTEPQSWLYDADSNAATRAKLTTEPGTVLGTPQYMSPEQARGQKVDARTDLFSLGVMLYEMLAGRAPFRGVNVIEVLAAILDREPTPLADARPDLPPFLTQLVHRALCKEPDARYQTAQELLRELQDLKEELSFAAKHGRTPSAALSPAPAALPQPATSVARFRVRRAWLLAPLLVLLGGAGWWLTLRRNTTAVAVPPPDRLKREEAVRWRGAPGDIYSSGRLSPNGQWVVYVSSESGSRNLWLKQLNNSNSQPLQVTKEVFRNDNPLWSPSGDELAFYSLRGQPGGIWRMPFSGGTPTLIRMIGDNSIRLLAWSPRGKIYYEINRNLFALDVASRDTTQLTNFDTSQIVPNTFSVSLDEEQLAYAANGPNGIRQLWVRPLNGGAPSTIATEAGQIRDLVWHTDNERILYSANRNGVYQLCVADSAGRQAAQLTFGEADSFVLDVSRDGKQILYGAAVEDSDVWGVRLADGYEFDITSDLSSELWPSVSPDGKTIAFQSIRNLNQANRMYEGRLLTRPAATTDTSEPPFQLSAKGALPIWSPDGKRVAFISQESKQLQLWTAKAEGGEARRLATGLNSIDFGLLPYQRYETHYFSWSPNSRQIVYGADRNGLHNFWLADADGSPDNELNLTDNRDSDLSLACPLWSSDGQRILYTSRTKKAGPNGRQTHRVWVVETASRVAKLLLESSDLHLRLLGWLRAEQEVLLAMTKTRSIPPVEATLMRLSLKTGAQHELATLPAVYFHNIHLSADQKMLAFTARADGKDNIWLLSTAGGMPRKLTDNRDPRLYFSSLAWDPTGRAIYFGKQTRHNLLTQLTNFE